MRRVLGAAPVKRLAADATDAPLTDDAGEQAAARISCASWSLESYRTRWRLEPDVQVTNRRPRSLHGAGRAPESTDDVDTTEAPSESASMVS